jgi:23S rRNA (adenine2030-N6)-methyltransferase
LKYRHRFHAGNFADVHKHVALLALLQAMQRKDKGFLYLDLQAGAGRYDLAAASSNHGAEARHGVTALMNLAASAAADAAAEIADYRAAVGALRHELSDPNVYPGSPWLAARALRAQDRGICWELLPAECRALERALGGFRRVRVECGDGYQQLRALLPPRERRCLLLIDPAYEQPAAEFERATQIILSTLERLANCVILLWYPIKDERTVTPWLASLNSRLPAPCLSLELWLYPRDSRVALNGSGLLLVNPPYQFEQRAALWQAELHALLDKAALGGSSLTWLVSDAGVDHASA